MYHRDLHLHFVGIGGVGMAGIAEILLNLGYSVSGSDLKPSQLTEHLLSLGANIHFGHAEQNLPLNTSVVVISSAVRDDNPEVMEAKRRGVAVIPRAAMLAELMRMKYGIAVAGSHGKTTTTSLIAKTLTDARLDPTVVIGGRVISTKTGARLGHGEYLVAEADESDGSFGLLRPAIAIVTNIDAEHLAHYGSFGALEEAFLNFMASVPFYGLVVACLDDPVVARLLPRLTRRVTTYGLNPGADWLATDIRFEGERSYFSVQKNGVHFCNVSLPLAGAHMVRNTLAAIAAAYELRVESGTIVNSLSDVPGVSRRSEVIARDAGVLVLDDYGHHPTEIRCTLEAIKNGHVAAWRSQFGENGRLLVVFQPHRYSRTRELFSEFLTAFSAADEVVITDIYPAGEEPIAGVSGRLLAEALQHPKIFFAESLSDIAQYLAARVHPGDVVLTLGAGNVCQVAYELKGLLIQEAGQEMGQETTGRRSELSASSTVNPIQLAH